MAGGEKMMVYYEVTKGHPVPQSSGQLTDAYNGQRQVKDGWLLTIDDRESSHRKIDHFFAADRTVGSAIVSWLINHRVKTQARQVYGGQVLPLLAINMFQTGTWRVHSHVKFATIHIGVCFACEKLMADIFVISISTVHGPYELRKPL